MTGIRKYIINRLLVAPITLFIASLFIFGVLRTIPGDAIAALFAEDSFFGGTNELRLQRGEHCRKFECCEALTAQQ